MKKLFALLFLFGLCDAQVVIILSNPVPEATAPVINPSGGSFGASTPYTITSPLGGSVIFTTDNSPPSLTNGTNCASPCAQTASVSITVKAISVVSGFSVSSETDAVFTITVGTTGTPTFSPSPGLFHSGLSVSLTLPAGATGYYTTDGSTPTTGSTVYSTPIPINSVGNTTLKAIAKASGLLQSAVATGVYTYQPPAATPVISPAAGPYTNSVNVTITDSCSGSVIYYTTNNQVPTTASTLYSGAFLLTTSSVVQAMVTCPLFAQSAVASASYTINITQPAPTPTFSPHAGPYATAQTVVISDTASNATIIYTTNGQPPITGTSCAAPCSITVSSTENVQAVATAAGFTTSAIGSALYTIGGTVLPCPQSSNGLSVSVTSPRSSGISPLFIFFDATGTTSSNIAANTTTFQDVSYTWNFGDSGASGSGTWAYGSNPNQNSTNSATGGVAAHLYITSGASQSFTPTVTATDGTATLTCSLPPVAVTDPITGFGGTSTTCVSAAATPVAGVGGCPVGATVLKSASYATALGTTYMGNGKSVLFHCGETYAGGLVSFKSQVGSIGAYGGCQSTQSNRPIFTGGGGGNLAIGSGNSADFDIRISDLDLEGGGNSSGTAIYGNSSVMPYQITVWNVLSNGNAKTFYDYNASQVGLIQLQMTGMGNFQGVFLNNSENQCVNLSHAYNCGGTPNFVNINYNAIIGSSMDGTGVTNNSNGIETTRVSACRMCVFTNSTYKNANTVGAVLKFHNGNPSSQANWIGQYTELTEVSDNLFTGKSGAQLVEITPQNSVTDERMRTIVFERNLLLQTAGNSGKLLASCQNCSFRDNVYNSTGGSGSQFGLQMARRGIEWNGGGGAPTNPSEPQYDEAYNETCYGSICVGFSASGGENSPGNNSWAKNILMYKSGGSGVAVTDSGSGNSVSNNTTNGNTGNNPGFHNGSGSFGVIPDFIPTANYSGGTPVPNFYDALGNLWSPTWDLGAVSNTSTVTLAQLKAAVQFSGCTFAGLVGTADAGSEATGTTQAGTQLTLFSNYVSLINRSHCNYIGRSVDMFTWAPIMSQIDTNLTAWKSQATNPSSIYLGVYMAEKVDTTNTTYPCTIAYCSGRNFIFSNMCVAGSSGSSCIVDFNQPETVAYFTQVGENLIDRGFQVFMWGKVTATDAKGTVTNSQLLATMNTLRAYASAAGLQVLFIAQNPSTFGGPPYVNSFDLIQGGVYINANGTIPNTPAVTNKNGVSAPERKWLATDYNYVLTNLVEEYDWYGDAYDDSSETACLSIPNTTGGQTYLTYVRALTNVPNGTSPNGPGCPLGNVITGSAVPATQTTYNQLKALGVGFWIPGRQKLAFPPGEYSPINLTLNTGKTPINWNDENMLQIGGSGLPSTYKFFAGNAAMSFKSQQNTPQSQVSSDVAALAANPVPGGPSAQMYVVGYRWPALDNGSPGTSPVNDAKTGTGQFAGFTSNLLAAYTALEAGFPGANFGFTVMANVYGQNYTANTIKTRVWTTQGLVVPANIAAGGCPSNCGTIAIPSTLGGTAVNYPIAPIYTSPSTSAYYGIAFNGCSNTGAPCTDGLPAWWNPGVNQDWINLWQALSLFTYAAPPGHPYYNTTAGVALTFDTDPLVKYIFSNDEYAYAMLSGYNPTDAGGVTVNPPNHLGSTDAPSNTNMFAATKAWATAVTGFFPHTMIGFPMTYGFSASNGNDTTTNTAGYVNQNITAGALSSIQGLALTSADTYSSDWVGTNGNTNTAHANYGKQGYAGYTAIPQPYGLGTLTAASQAGAMPNVAQVQPQDFNGSFSSGVSCITGSTILQCSGVVSAISAAANNAIVQDNMLLWWMDDGLTHPADNGNWFWINVIAPTINGANAGVTPFSTTRPSNLP